MPADDDKKPNLIPKDLEKESDSDSGQGDGEGGSGGKSGQIEFRDFIGGERLRDDLLPIDEKNRLLTVHKDTHERNVKKQKERRDEYKALKEGKVSLQSYRQGLAGGMSSQYKINPILADKAQFSGIDRQVNFDPTLNEANTNDDLRNELENQYRLRYAPELAPRFNPKPQYR